MDSSRIVSIPLVVILRNENKEVKQTEAQLRITPIGNTVRLIAACQEGVFEKELTETSIRNGKDKTDLQESEWLGLTSSLLGNAALSFVSHRAILWGKLISLEEYDPHTGSLLGDELAEEAPEFELSIRTEGVLPITYGLFLLKFVNVEEISPEDRAEYDMLTWVGFQARKTKQLLEKLQETQNKLQEYERTLSVKEHEIEEMTSDYKLIIRDLEDRFFQVLNSKKRRIFELEGNGNCKEALESLNLVYEERNALNLHHIKVEDILSGDSYKNYVAAYTQSAPKRRRVRKSPQAKSLPKSEPDSPIQNKDECKNASDEDDQINASSDDDDDDDQKNLEQDSLMQASSGISETEPNGESASSPHIKDVESSDEENPLLDDNDTDYGSESQKEEEGDDTDYGSD